MLFQAPELSPSNMISKYSFTNGPDLIPMDEKTPKKKVKVQFSDCPYEKNTPACLAENASPSATHREDEETL